MFSPGPMRNGSFSNQALRTGRRTVRFYNRGRVAHSWRPMNPHPDHRPGQPRGSPQPGAGNLHAGCDVARAGNGFTV